MAAGIAFGIPIMLISNGMKAVGLDPAQVWAFLIAMVIWCVIICIGLVVIRISWFICKLIGAPIWLVWKLLLWLRQPGVDGAGSPVEGVELGSPVAGPGGPTIDLTRREYRRV